MFRRLFPILLLAGCASQERLEWLEHEIELVAARPAPAETDLSERADLDTIVDLVLARYPSLRESIERTASMSAMARAAGKLEDPMMMFKLDDQMIRRDADVEKVVFGLQQMLPWPGKLDLARTDAVGRAEAMLHERRARERELALMAKRAYYDYYRWVWERHVREEHLKLLDSIGKLTEASYEAGKVSQQDILKPQVERGMVQKDLFEVERMIEMARIRLNLLMQRAPDAPLGPPAAARTTVELDPAALTARAIESRPEIRGLRARIQAARAAYDLADKNSVYPDFTLGVEYMQRPEDADEAAIMAGINLPWLTGRRAAEAEAARRTLLAEEAALDVARTEITEQVREALLRLQAADRQLDLIDRQLLSLSKQSVEAAMSAYGSALAVAADVLDAERSQRDIQIEVHRALADRETAVAELERALGTDLRRKP
ncbi:MAG: TolC family protein [Planctomycetes bacterium]|nr:TolC family protein [Planctomycetota bacterium]